MQRQAGPHTEILSQKPKKDHRFYYMHHMKYSICGKETSRVVKMTQRVYAAAHQGQLCLLPRYQIKVEDRTHTHKAPDTHSFTVAHNNKKNLAGLVNWHCTVTSTAQDFPSVSILRSVTPQARCSLPDHRALPSTTYQEAVHPHPYSG